VIDLHGKTILVTGASRGIGAATALALDTAGARVVMTYGRSVIQAEEVAGRCTNDPVLLQADLAQPGAASALFDDAVNAVGTIDVVVNNAGIAPEANVGVDDDTWAEVWQSTMQVNLFSLADICRKAITHFVPQGGGTLINIASRAAIRGDEPNMMHYAASKGAVVALTRSIARGYGNEGIIAHTVNPGWVSTDMAVDFFAANPDAPDGFPLGEAVPPEEVANTIAFLASGLARHLTGSTIEINGATHVR
jgi:3-oxoacyl-[acyl-carrier protein] reductase